MQPNPIDLFLYHQEPGFVCPDEFWPAFGYDRAAPLVGIWWDATTDEACWCDGRATYIGAEPTAYRLLLARNFPPGHPAHWLLGVSGTPATMWLTISRLTGRAWLVAADDAAGILAAQHLDAQDAAADWFPEAFDGPRPAARGVTGAWREPALTATQARDESEAQAARHEALEAALRLS